MAHPQHNFTSNFNGSVGHNAELTLNINGVPKKYTPAGNDKEYNVPGVAHIDIDLDGADLVSAIRTALSGDAHPVLVELGVADEKVYWLYAGTDGESWYFTLTTLNAVSLVAVSQSDGSITHSHLDLANGVVIVRSDDAELSSKLYDAYAIGQLPVLEYVDDNVYANFETIDDDTDEMLFVSSLASSSDTGVEYKVYAVANDNSVTVTTRTAANGGNFALIDETFGSGDNWSHDASDNYVFTSQKNDAYYRFSTPNVAVASLTIKLPALEAGQGYRVTYQLGGNTVTNTPVTLVKNDGSAVSLLRRSDSLIYDSNNPGSIYWRCIGNILTIVGNYWLLSEYNTNRQPVTQADLNSQLAALKSRILYTIPIGCIDKPLQVNLEASNGIGACHCTLFNPNMNQDLYDGSDGNWSNVVVYLGETAQTVTTHLIFAIYEFDRNSNTFKWIANTDDLANDGDLKGLRHFRLTHVKTGQGSLFSDHLYMFCMLGNVNTLVIAGNQVPGTLNSNPLFVACGNHNFPSSGSLNAATLENDIPTINTATFSITSCKDRDGDKACRVFASITNIQNVP